MIFDSSIMQKEQDYLILAYADDKALENIKISDLRKMTHVNLAFGVLEDGLLSLSRLKNLPMIDRLRKEVPHVRWVLSIGGWQADGFSQMAATAIGRNGFAASVRKSIDQWKLDGVDIDWEFPCNDVGGISASPNDKTNYTLLLQALRNALGDDKIVSVAVSAEKWFIENTEMEKVAKIVDYVQIMTYDMRPGIQSTGHHTALFDTEDKLSTSVDSAVNRYIAAGVQKEKIVIGSAHYGRSWKGKQVGMGLGMPAETYGEYGPGYGDIAKMLREGKLKEQWDDRAKASYIAQDGIFISYDSPHSVMLKCEYLKEKGLLGIMYWLHRLDDTGTLLDAAYKVLSQQ